MSFHFRATMILVVTGLIAAGCNSATTSSSSPTTGVVSATSAASASDSVVTSTSTPYTPVSSATQVSSVASDSTTTAPTTTVPTSTSVVAARPAKLVSRTCDTSPDLPPTTCYWLEVPERRDRADSRTIRLWVAVIRSVGAAADATPSIFLNGGPGYAASTPFTSGNVTIVGKPGIIAVIDQRGSGRSEPRLDCAELHIRLDATHPWAERVAATNAAARTCKQTMQASGIDLDGYNSVESAADIVDLRKALGYSTWIVGGVSYGGRLAREVYRQDPTGVAGLLLDSAVTTAPVGPVGLVQVADSAIARLTEACNVQPACSTANGNLTQDLAAAAARLDAHPYIVDATASSPAWAVAGDDLYDGAILAMYRTDLIPSLPGIAVSLASGDDSAIAAINDQVNPSPSADPRDDYALVDDQVNVCADEGAAMTAADHQVLTAPGRWSSLVLSWAFVNCAVWGVAPVPGGHLAAPSGDLPVLATNGQLDPVTPPAYADEIRSQFPHATTVVYPGGGHGVLFTNDCATKIALSFYDTPTQLLDTSCIATLAQPFAS